MGKMRERLVPLLAILIFFRKCVSGLLTGHHCGLGCMYSTASTHAFQEELLAYQLVPVEAQIFLGTGRLWDALQPELNSNGRDLSTTPHTYRGLQLLSYPLRSRLFIALSGVLPSYG